MHHYNITIRGKVQAVGFRFSAMEAAYRHGIKGFVKNLGSDSVYIEAEGESDKMELFLAWCRKGPWGARVESMNLQEGPLRSFTSFEIVSRDFESS